MPGSKNKNGRHALNDWRCHKKSCHHQPSGATHFNFASGPDTCFICHEPRRPNAVLFSQTDAGKTQAANGGGAGPKGGGAGGGGNGGAGGGAVGNGGGSKSKEQLATEAKLRKVEADLKVERAKNAHTVWKADKPAIDSKIAKREAELAKLRGQQSNITAIEDDTEEEAATGDAAPTPKDLKNAETDCRDAAKKAKDRPGDSRAQAQREEAKQYQAKLLQLVRDSKDPHEQVAKKSARASKLAEKNKKLLSELTDKVEEYEAAMQEAADLKAQIEANEEEIDTLNSQMASLTFAKAEAGPPDLAATAQAVYTDLLNSFQNPLLADDATVAAEKAKLEVVYKTLSDTFAEMAQYKAYLESAANAAAQKAAERAAESKPPEALDDASPAEDGATAPAIGLLALPATLRPDTGDRGRDAPYAARTIVQRPPKLAGGFSLAASSDMAGTTRAVAATATAAVKPTRERTKAELMESVAKVPKTIDASTMDV